MTATVVHECKPGCWPCPVHDRPTGPAAKYDDPHMAGQPFPVSFAGPVAACPECDTPVSLSAVYRCEPCGFEWEAETGQFLREDPRCGQRYGAFQPCPLPSGHTELHLHTLPAA